jgi:hypothetical protein
MKTAYTVKEAVEEFGRPKDKILAALKGGYLIGHRDGHTWVLFHDDLVDWIRSMPSEPIRRSA